MRIFQTSVLLTLVLLLGGCASYNGYTSGPDQDRMVRDRDSAKLDNATAVISEIMATPDNGIPADLLLRAQGIAVVPSFLKAGFIFGADYGKGVLVRRLPDGSWSKPSFMTMGGGNFGLQIGAESTDLVLVFTTGRSLDAMHTASCSWAGRLP